MFFLRMQRHRNYGSNAVQVRIILQTFAKNFSNVNGELLLFVIFYVMQNILHFFWFGKEKQRSGKLNIFSSKKYFLYRIIFDVFKMRTNSNYAKFVGNTKKYNGNATVPTVKNSGAAVIVGTKLSF